MKTIKYNGLDIPETVYKYRAWNDGEGNNHNRLITHREIYLAGSKSFFADYPECRLPIKYKEYTDEELDGIAIRHAIDLFNPRSEIELRLLASQLRAKMVYNDIENRKRVEKEFDDKIENSTGVFCTSTNGLSESVWDTFGDLGKGYAVGLNPICINEFLQGSCGWIMYYKPDDDISIPAISSSFEERVINMTRQFFSVPIEYQQEEEFRFVRTNRTEDESTYDSYDDRNRAFELPVDCFNELLLGPDISSEDKNLIIKLTKENLGKLPIYQVTDTKDGLVKVKI